MFENCTCCNGCSSKKSSSFINNFPKKLLVATSVLVIITMCLTPCGARTVEHKIRHERRHDSLTQPAKEMSKLRVAEPLKRRPIRTQTKDTPALIRQRNAQADQFKTALTKIKRKLKNTRAFFNDERRVLNDSRDYRAGMPSWLPSTNFVDIHFHKYRNPRRTGASLSERKFIYLMPKLYKSLVEFHDIFKHLAKVEVNFADEPFYIYNKTRQELLEKTLHRLYSTIAEIEENMISVNVPVPQINQHKNINTLDLKVDAPQCLKNDYIAFRAYGNLLNNWYFEFRCPRGKKVISDNSSCAAYEGTLIEKKQTRPPRGKKNVAS